MVLLVRAIKNSTFKPYNIFFLEHLTQFKKTNNLLDNQVKALLAEDLRKYHHSILPFYIADAYCNGSQMTVSKDTLK